MTSLASTADLVCETIDDYSAAVMPYARERIGKKKYKSKLHFACRFPDPGVPQWPSHEDWKCFAMNRRKTSSLISSTTRGRK